ncbi:hypothetical protein BH20ACT2_BH20ACT2_02880 [soil metagenome]
MFTTGSRFFFGLAIVGFLAAASYGLVTGDGFGMDALLGVTTLGYKGHVGEHVGYSTLMGLGAASAFMGCVTAAFRDADANAQAEFSGADRVPAATAPDSSNHWPIVGAFAVTTTAVGLVVSPVLFVVGLVALGIVTLEWMVQAWAERATGDPEVNRTIRNRVMNPVEIPAVALIGIAAVVLLVSRVLLALPKAGSTVIAMAVPAIVLGVGALIATRPKLGSSVVAALCLLGGVGLLTGGVVSAVVGEREFHEHEEEEPAAEAEGGATADDADAPGDGAEGDGEGDGAEDGADADADGAEGTGG